MYIILVHDEYSVQGNKLPSAFRNDLPFCNVNEFLASIIKSEVFDKGLINYLLIRLILTFLQPYSEAQKK